MTLCLVRLAVSSDTNPQTPNRLRTGTGEVATLVAVSRARPSAIPAIMLSLPHQTTVLVSLKMACTAAAVLLR